MHVLSLDLGTSVAKAVRWEIEGGQGKVAGVGRAGLTTTHPRPGWAEQDPKGWWAAAVEACRAAGPGPADAVVLCGARQSFVLLDDGGRPLGPGIVWSDARAVDEAAALVAEAGGTEPLAALSGIRPDARSVLAKCRWLERHEPGLWAQSARLVAPRDLVVRRLCGAEATDWTLASATGLFGPGGDLLAGELARRLPEVVPPATVVGGVTRASASELGVAAGTPVVLGAGDRPCEVLGSGASPAEPMVSWGTTANASAPLAERPSAPGLAVTRGALGGWLVEAGLAAAGSLLEWLGVLGAPGPQRLSALARGVEPGARGVVVTPWLGGARAPWWADHVGAALFGLHAGHGLAEVARAAFEGVAFDLAFALETVAAATGCSPEALVLAGGADLEVWVSVVTAVVGVPGRRRASGLAASAGAALIALTALGEPADPAGFDPVVEVRPPDASAVRVYEELREPRRALCRALLAALPGRH